MPAAGADTSSRTGPAAGFPRAWVAALVASALLAGLAIVWLALPAANPLDVSAPPLVRLTGASGAAIAQLALAVGGLGLAIAHLVRLARPAAQRAAPTGAWLRGAALAVAMLAGLGLLGFTGIAVSGYTMVLLIPIAAVVSLVLLGTRRPLVALGIAAVAAALVVLGEVAGAAPIARFFVTMVGSIWQQLPQSAEALATIAFTGTWMLVAVGGAQGGRVADVIRRARVPITIAAAACSLPYVIARATWLTPWPLFGSPELISADPVVLVLGLSLGLAMALGGVLTLGLVRPWGERFPRWMGRLGGREVPIAAAVVPALIVAALFTFGGVGLAVDGLLGAGPLREMSWTMGLVLPFWLWGPLLAMAAWGYRAHRLRGAATATAKATAEPRRR